MSSGFFTVGVTGLNAAQAGLLTAGHNISNASTAGYNRQYVVQTTNTPMFTGSGFLGQGTSIQTVKRVYSEFLQKEVRIAETNVAELETYTDEINQLDSLLADPSAGLSPALQSFFSATDAAASSPASIPARQAMLSAAQSLVARFNSLDQQLREIRSGVNSQVVNEIGTINSLVQQVANINQRIIVAQAAAASQPANDLLDQRDKLVSDLNKEIQVSVQVETDGSYSLFFGSGQPLLVGGQTYSLTPRTSAEDLTEMEVALTSPNGQLINIPESLVTGGVLGGLLRFRSGTLDTAQNQFGRVAMAMATTINAQHLRGQDLDGTAAGNFFKTLTPAVQGAPANAGTAIIAANITISDYKVSYDGTNYNVTRLSDSKLVKSTADIPLVVDGIKFSIAAGTPQAGDVFLIKPGALPSERVSKIESASDAMLATTGSNLQTLGDSDFRLTRATVGTFTLTRISDSTTWTGQGATQELALADLMNQIAPQGFSISLSTGQAEVGDSFLIRPTRYAARDIAVAVTDPRDIALAQGFRTAAAATNGGTGVISAGSVVKTDEPLSTPVKLSYDSATNSLVGFPVGSQVLLGSTVYNVTSTTQRVPYQAGYNYSFNGTGFMLSGTPSNGDSFIINPPPGTPTAGNNGFAALFGTPVSAPPAATGSLTPATATSPLTVVAGTNDNFAISVDGGATANVTLPAGTYTPSSLASQIQTKINAAIATQGTAVTVTLDGTNRLVVTSNNGAGSIALSAANPNSGSATIAAAQVTQTSSLPAAPITLTYRQATTAGLPVRLTGFPAGSTVTVIQANGTTREYSMNSADGYGDADAFSDYVDFTSGATIVFNGMRFSISGNPADGDTFTLGPNTSATGDNRNALAVGALQLSNVMGDGTATYQSAYAAIVSTIGNKAREIAVTLTAQENLVTQAQKAIDSASGVNLDEEAANLIRYQQAYQASAKILDMSGKLFDLITSLGG
ncbi:MAG: flagellar hook-associated protein FlgK [Sterolibacteriaceae bacterium MAG5]|nr:flagellar hook-associated protein FlgK [Candidatus Nitricoxidireducens bremensis]